MCECIVKHNSGVWAFLTNSCWFLCVFRVTYERYDTLWFKSSIVVLIAVFSVVVVCDLKIHSLCGGHFILRFYMYKICHRVSLYLHYTITE